MALSSGIVWEVRQGGSDSSGGGYKTGASGTDFTQQDAAQYALTGLTTAAANAIILTASAAADMVGNVIQITSGTNFTVGFYEITSVSVGVSITVDRNCTTAAGTGGVGNIGGALASPGMAGGAKVAGNDIYVKSGTYTLSTASSNVSGGVVDDATGGENAANATWWIGYNTTRTKLNTDSSLPLIQVPGSGVTSCTIFKTSSDLTRFRNLKVDGASKSSIRGFDIGTNFTSNSAIACTASNCTNSGFYVASGLGSFIVCLASGCSSTGAGFQLEGGFGTCLNCVAADGSVHGFTGNDRTRFIGCIADSNSGASTDGFHQDNGNSPCVWINCVSYNSGRDGFRSGSSFQGSVFAMNCTAYGNAGYGFNGNGSTLDVALLWNCAGGSNTSGNTESGLPNLLNFIDLSTNDPFVNAAGGNFALNTSTGGNLCRAAGFPGVFPGGTTTGYLDIGAAQHQDAGGLALPVSGRIVG